LHFSDFLTRIKKKYRNLEGCYKEVMSLLFIRQFNL
jgi:hypothetical protein